MKRRRTWLIAAWAAAPYVGLGLIVWRQQSLERQVMALTVAANSAVQSATQLIEHATVESEDGVRISGIVRPS